MESDQPEAPKESIPTLHLTAEPSSIDVTVIGDESISKEITLYCTPEKDEVKWEAEDDAPWLKTVPTRGKLDCGTCEVTIWIYAAETSVGSHEANLSFIFPEEEGAKLNVKALLEVLAEDSPEAVQKFWQATEYEIYWESRAREDVINAVMAFDFPNPVPPTNPDPDDAWSKIAHPENIEWERSISIQSCEFEFDTYKNPRPTAEVECSIKFSALHALWDIRYHGDAVVVLEVQKGPYSRDTNEWEVLYYKFK
jgi:hypothetical protein